jgi:hypothetical protein
MNPLLRPAAVSLMRCASTSTIRSSGGSSVNRLAAASPANPPPTTTHSASVSLLHRTGGASGSRIADQRLTPGFPDAVLSTVIVRTLLGEGCCIRQRR